MGENRGSTMAQIAALIALTLALAVPCEAQEKVRFPIGESSKTLSYGPLWVAGKWAFSTRKG